ncbi:hypothetical protein SPW_4938 [Streptomyces sp. W007]|nr:hypothetical protein SPW_4938 [Streptomyces sp. W007]
MDQLTQNLRLNPRPAQDVVAELATHLLPHFPTPNRPPARLHI